MESPVRICLVAAIVVNLLLLCNAPVEGLALPNDTTPTTVKDERPPRVKNNATWTARHKSRAPDVALNELITKETEEEHTEKNARYKNRGNRKFGDKKSTTTAPKRRSTSTTEAVTLVIVTPTPEVKKPAQIIDSMRNYKKTKMPISSTTPISASSSEESEESDSYEKFQESSYTIPSFNDYHDFSHELDSDSANNKVKKDNKSPYDFPSYSKEDSYGFKEDKEPFKSSFFDFDSELTTPKNDFFDKKHQKISSSIVKKLDLIKLKSPPPNVTNIHKIVQQNIGLEKMNNTPSNKSSVYFKNTKEIRLSDNEGAGTANKEFSDVYGTSVYYELSVHSTDTYTMDQSQEDDCDETLETTTAPTKNYAKLIKATLPTMEESKPTMVDKSETQSTLASHFMPISTLAPFYSTSTPVAYSTQSYFSNERITKLFPNRNRTYSKRLDLTATKDSLNSVTPKPEVTYTLRPQTRSKFHSTTPRTKPVWMAPKRNSTRVYIKTTSPRTIYEEHFSIKELPTTAKPLKPSRTVLTTVSSSEIDPVLQTDIIGTSKVVNSLFVTDNTIPSLSKRGSTRYKGSTPSSAEVDSNLAELEMPSTAWALASLISPPSLPGSVVNATENELQKVGEIIDKKQTTAGLTTTSTVSSISNDIITKKFTDVDQNKLQWQPVYTPTAPSDENKITVENKESLPAESNISLQSTSQPATAEAVKDNTLDAVVNSKEVKPLWIPATVETATTTDKNDVSNITSIETIQPIDASRSIGFESITKLPADVTTPQDESVAISEVNQTVTEKTKVSTDYEITTIRFSYGTTIVPTEQTEDVTNTISFETTTTSAKPSFVPTRTKITTIDEDTPITTYRPSYTFSTEIEESTTIASDTTPILEVSSQIISNTTEPALETTDTAKLIEIITQPTIEVTTETHTEPDAVLTTTVKETSAFETTHATDVAENTTTTVIQVVTEINTEKSTIITVSSSTDTVTSSEETYSTSVENSHSNEIIYEIKTEEPSEKPGQETTTAKQRQSETTQATTISEEKTSEENESEEKETTTTERQDTTEDVSKPVSGIEDLNEVTTESASRGPEEAGAGAAIAIAVSTIGVIALVLLIGLLLVVRRRGRRGVYAQRCTPVSLDAYSLDSVSVGHRKGNNRLRASKRSYGNPAYDDEVTSHPMEYPALASFALDVDSICAEFAEIPNVSVKGEEVPPGCEDKNRYSNVLPLPETRVPLQRINNDPTSEYINANFVTGPGNIRNYYILAQAPLANTVVDFWRMIWEQNSRLIVMLTEYMENGVEKCYEYVPPSEVSDNKRVFGDFNIILKKREQKDKYAVSTIQVINMATRTWREVTHLWYFWPAKGLPEDYDSVIDFLFEMRSYMKVSQTAKEYDEEGVEVIYGDLNRSSFNNLTKMREGHGSNGVHVYSPAKAEELMRTANNGTLSRMKAASEVEGIRPCVVTCASGAGRAAALAALDTCARALCAGRADVPRAVRALRAMRAHALPNRHHYVWLYKVLSEYGNKIMGGADNI